LLCNAAKGFCSGKATVPNWVAVVPPAQFVHDVRGDEKGFGVVPIMKAGSRIQVKTSGCRALAALRNCCQAGYLQKNNEADVEQKSLCWNSVTKQRSKSSGSVNWADISEGG
jgi:hypothetical protein